MENQSMSAKKNTTGRKAKVTQGRSKPASKKADAQEKEGELTFPDLSIKTSFSKEDVEFTHGKQTA
jgi:hypothetical protein